MIGFDLKSHSVKYIRSYNPNAPVFTQCYDELVSEFRIEWDQYSSHFTLEGKPRQRIALPRKTSVLPGYQDKLLFLTGVFENISITGTSGGHLFNDTASSQLLDPPVKPNSSQNAQKAMRAA